MKFTNLRPTRLLIAATAILQALDIATSASAQAGGYPGGISDLRVAKGTGEVAESWFANATTRYRHFVLGSRYEAATLSVRLRNGTIVSLNLPEESVFEDRQPRLADLDGDGIDEIVVVRSHVKRGAALSVVALRDNGLSIIAETPPTGRPNTWLNPAGIADFNGDGRLDIAYVQMPHILGLLRVWTLREGKLVEVASVEDTSNHDAGSPHLGLSAVADFDNDGVSDLAVPSRDRKSLRFLSFKGTPRELARKPLRSPASRDFRLKQAKGGPLVAVGLDAGGTQWVSPF